MEHSKVLNSIGLGGGCHWCTEAIYLSLIGVIRVDQGFIASVEQAHTPSEAVIVHFNPEIIGIETLVKIHLYTHKSTAKHSMRAKYRSAIYYNSEGQKKEVELIINKSQSNFSEPIITRILPFKSFESSDPKFQNYYYSNPDKPFCKSYISPKLQLLQKEFAAVIDANKISTSIN